MRKRGVRYRTKDLLIATAVVATVATIYAVLGLPWTGTIAAFVLTFAAPVVVVMIVGPFPATASAGRRGVAIAIISGFVSWMLYILLIGEQSPQLIGGRMGPGLRNIDIDGICTTIFFFCIGIWPLCLLVFGGAAAGVVGQLLRKRLDKRADREA